MKHIIFLIFLLLLHQSAAARRTTFGRSFILTGDSVFLFYACQDSLPLRFNRHEPLDGRTAQMIPYRQKDLYGFVANKPGAPQWLLRPAYTYVQHVCEDKAIVQSDYKYCGVVDKGNREIVPSIHDCIVREGNMFHAVDYRDTLAHRKLWSAARYGAHSYYADDGRLLFRVIAHDYEPFHPDDSFACFRFGMETSVYDRAGNKRGAFVSKRTEEFICVCGDLLVFLQQGADSTDVLFRDAEGRTRRRLRFRSTEPDMFAVEDCWQISPELLHMKGDRENFICDLQGRILYYLYSWKEHDDAADEFIVSGSFHAYAQRKKRFTELYNKERTVPGADTMALLQKMLDSIRLVWPKKDPPAVGVVDRYGKVLVPLKYEHVERLDNGYFLCGEDREQCLLVNRSGAVKADLGARATLKELLLDAEFTRQRAGVCEGLLRINPSWYLRRKVEGMYLNHPIRADWLESDLNSEDHFADRFRERKPCYIDTNGNVLQEFEQSTELLGNFSEGLAPVVDSQRKMGFIDRSGIWRIPPQYKVVLDRGPYDHTVRLPAFQGGFAWIVSMQAYIDREGNEYFSGDAAYPEH